MQSEMQPWSPLLCNELIEYILSWLPVKSLIQCKCVCKGWNSLMSDPYFIKLHLRKSSAKDDLEHLRLITNVYFGSIPAIYKESCTVSSLFHSLQIERSLLNYPNILDSFGICNGKMDKYLLVGSCNGLHCEVSKRSEGYHVQFLNKATRVISGKSPTLCFFTGSSCGRTQFGFGYDPSSDNYKVVAMTVTRLSRDKSVKTEMKVYGMGDSCWRNLDGFPDLWSLPKVGGVYLSGTLNWVVMINDAAKLEMVIVSVDLEKETCRSLFLPDINLHFVDLNIGVFRDSLCVWQDYNHTHLGIWQMREFGDNRSWIQLINFCHLRLQIHPFESQPMFLPLCMPNNGDIFMLMFTSNAVEYRTIFYNQKDDKLQVSSIPTHSFRTLMGLNLKIFTESLVIPY